MKLKEITINTVYKHPLSIMNKYAWCVQEQYWSYLKKYDTGRWQKVVIEVDDNLSLINKSVATDQSYTDVAIVSKYFDIGGFLDSDNVEKKKALLKLLHITMLYLAECCNWEKESLINAYNQCIDTGIEYKFKVKDKNFKSPSGEFFGYVLCYWDITNFTAIGVISRKQGVILKQEILINIEPYHAEFIYNSRCKWDDNYTFSLYSKDGKKWSIGVLSLV